MTPACLRAAADDPEAVLRVLPVQAREIAMAIGLSATIELMRLYGGHRLFVPAVVSDKLIAEIGVELAAALVEARGGTTIESPSLRSIERLLRDNAIRADFDAGVSVAELVGRYRLSDRHIRVTLTARATTAPSTRPAVRLDPFAAGSAAHSGRRGR
jgi:Mor transcription activator family